MENCCDQLWRQLQIGGFCVLQDVIPPDECSAIRNSITRTVQSQRNAYPGAPNNVGFTPSVINHDQSFAAHLADDRLLALIQQLLGHNIRISFTSAIINEPGNDRGDWHADWPFNQKNAGHIPVPYPDVVMHVTTLWMLSPFSVDNGGTLILPGSHRHATNPTAGDGPNPREPFPTEINVTGSVTAHPAHDFRCWQYEQHGQITEMPKNAVFPGQSSGL